VNIIPELENMTTDRINKEFRYDPLLKVSSLLVLVLGLFIWAKLTLSYTKLPSDFVQDYLAGLALLKGISIYGETFNLFSTLPAPGFVENFHPPFNALLFFPFALFEFSTAFILWSVISLVAYLLVVSLALKDAPFPKTLKTFLFSISLLWYPFIFDIGTGNSSSVIVAAIYLGWLALKNNRAPLAGILFGLACLLKFFPGILILFLLTQKKWVASLSMALSIITGLFISLLVVGSEDFLFYFTDVMPKNVLKYGSYPINISLTGLFLPLLTENVWVSSVLKLPESIALFLLKVFSLIFIMLTVIRFLVLGRSDEYKVYAFSLTCVAMVLASPISWSHILPITLIPMVVLALEKDKRVTYFALIVMLGFSLPDVDLAQFLQNSFTFGTVPSIVYFFSRFETFGLLALWWLLAYPGTFRSKGL